VGKGNCPTVEFGEDGCGMVGVSSDIYGRREREVKAHLLRKRRKEDQCKERTLLK